MGILIAFLVLSLLIFFHELGHFLAARACGVRVEVFSIGFGRKIASVTRGGTQYALSAIPLGGYVKMKGQDDADPTAVSADPDSYNAKRPWQRLVILFAGPFANFVVAFVLYLAYIGAGFTALAPVVGQVSAGSAAAASLRPGDTILRVDERPIRMWDEIGREVRASTHPLTVTFRRDGQVRTCRIDPRPTPVKTIFGETVFERLLGIAPRGETVELSLPWDESMMLAARKTWDASTLIAQSVQKLVTGVVSPDNVGGVISIVDITAKVSASGWQALALLTALISVNLGVLNLLPIPALDGGHMIFTLYEMVTRRVPGEAVLYRLTLVGWALLGSLMLLGLYNDIHRLTVG